MTDEANPWRLLQRQKPFDCPYFQVWQDTVSHTGGTPRPYFSVRMKYHGVAVAAVDAAGQLILVGQYRHVLERYAWEIPGGGAALATDRLAVAKAELEEETGCRARHWLKVVEGSASPGIADEITAGYVAWDLEEGEPRPEAEELLAHRRVPFAEAVAMALNGQLGNMVGIGLVLGLHARCVRGDLPDDLRALLAA
jgi:8-oxo-dGTP pyrophosphatase MutT (NUDIX family)